MTLSATQTDSQGESPGSERTGPLDDEDSFRKTRSRATWAGAAAAFTGLVYGSFMVALLLDVLAAGKYPDRFDTGGFGYIFWALTCSPYSLLGAVVGAAIGRRAAARGFRARADDIVFRYAVAPGAFAGLALGALPYALLWLYDLLIG